MLQSPEYLNHKNRSEKRKSFLYSNLFAGLRPQGRLDDIQRPELHCQRQPQPDEGHLLGLQRPVQQRDPGEQDSDHSQ